MPAGTGYVWDAGGGTDTSWFNPLNWAPDGIPSAADSATLSSNATITLPSPASVASFVQSDGILTGPGGLTVSSFTWSGGTQGGTGATTVPVGGSLLIDGAA